MEISEKEYYELQFQVRALQSQVNAMSDPKRITNLASMVREPVIDRVRCITRDKPVFGYSSSMSCDTWTLLLQMAKNIHEPSALFRKEMRISWGEYQHPYINMIFNQKKPRRITDLTPEQIRVSVQMLDEIIPIYNRYFKDMHQRVMYDPTGKGEYESYGVIDEQVAQSEREG